MTNSIHTVSHICNFICLPSIVIIRAPNSTPERKRNKNLLVYFFDSEYILTTGRLYNLTLYNKLQIRFIHSLHFNTHSPIVKSWTGWKRLSVNWSKRHDFPTPKSQGKRCSASNDEQNKWSHNGGTSYDFQRLLAMFTLFHDKTARIKTSSKTSWNHQPVSPIMMYLKRYA